MSLGVGARLGHYSVTAKIGAGGMGEVPRTMKRFVGDYTPVLGRAAAPRRGGHADSVYASLKAVIRSSYEQCVIATLVLALVATPALGSDAPEQPRRWS